LTRASQQEGYIPQAWFPSLRTVRAKAPRHRRPRRLWLVKDGPSRTIWPPPPAASRPQIVSGPGVALKRPLRVDLAKRLQFPFTSSKASNSKFEMSLRAPDAFSGATLAPARSAGEQSPPMLGDCFVAKKTLLLRNLHDLCLHIDRDAIVLYRLNSAAALWTTRNDRFGIADLTISHELL